MSVKLPEGSVSFLFSDVEQSTELARRSVGSFPALIKAHFEIIERAVRASEGAVVKNTGDGVLAVFREVDDALEAAIAIQAGISGHAWPVGLAIRVRIGVHTGEAVLENGDYFGIEVNRAARVMAAGHGGQVLVSGPARAKAGNRFGFRDLGRHILKGLDEAEPIFQLAVPGLPAEFPPLATASLIPNNLPTRSSSILGREDDRRALAQLVVSERLVTVLGQGGVGKTSLALSVARELIESFPGGVTFVDLSAVRGSEFVVAAIATEVGADQKTFESLVDRLQGSKRLLVLDNLEHLTDAAKHVTALLDRVADVHLLVTSQVPLRLSVEKRFQLEPFPIGGGADSPGVSLFLDRARSVSPDFEADPDVVAELVSELAGLPLAIELVAARANLLGAGEMLSRLRADQSIFKASSDAPQRQRSVIAALEWSHGLLEETTRGVLRKLSLFSGGFTLEAAETVAAAPGVDVLEEVGELVDRSMVTRRLDVGGRFGMLDSVRRFATNQLASSEDMDDTADRFVDFYLELGEGASRGLQSDRGEWWQDHLEAELDNVREVLSMLRAESRTDEALGLLGDIWRFHLSRGHLLELQRWLDEFFDMSGSADGVGRVKGIMAQGAVYYWQRRSDEAVEAYEEAVELARNTGDDRLLADALFGLATSLATAEQVDVAEPHLSEAERLYVKLGDESGIADVVAGEAFAARLKAGSLVGLEAKLAKAVELYEKVGRRIQGAQTIYAMAGVAIAEGRQSEARGLVTQGLDTGIELADVILQAWGVDYMALVEFEAGNLERAGLLAGAIEVAKEKIGGGWGPESVGLDPAATRLSQELGEAGADEVIAPGRELSLDEAVAHALSRVV